MVSFTDISIEDTDMILYPGDAVKAFGSIGKFVRYEAGTHAIIEFAYTDGRTITETISIEKVSRP